MKRRTDETIFLDELRYMAGEPPARVSSRALIQRLDWRDDRYHRARTRLIAAGVVRGVLGGPGGSLELLAGTGEIDTSGAVDQKPAPISAFVSYSHADAKLKTELLNHLSPLQRLGLIDHWHDSEIQPGCEWEPAIARQLDASQLVLLLVSSDFVASNSCYENELTSALKRHEAGSARVLPIILRPCLWQDLQFGRLQATPRDGKPVTSWSNIDEALTDAAMAVREAAQTIRATLGATPATPGAAK